MPGNHDSGEATRILFDERMDASERAARLMPLVYSQLRAMAQKQMGSERRNHTLQPTALVNEAFLKLAQNREVPWQNRAHFCVAAAEAMRQILLDHAREKNALKRGGVGRGEDGKPRGSGGESEAGAGTGRSEKAKRLPLDVIDLADSGEPEMVEALNESLERLKVENPELAQIVQLRFYAGRSMEEVSSMLGIPERTLDRRWKFARAWLHRELTGGEDDERREPGADDA